MKNIILTILLLCLPFYLLRAQNMTNSPVSMFGLGELTTGEGGQYAGLGGAGIALRSDNFLNGANPAALTALDKQRFQFDLGVTGVLQSYSQHGSTSISATGNINNISAGFRITPRWYASIYFLPFSSVGYAITEEEDVLGDNSQIASLYEGDGGLSKLGISVAYLFGKNFSLGVNLSYVSGNISQTETNGTAVEEYTSSKRTFYADFGAQYKWKMNEEDNIVIGMTYGYPQRFNQDNNLTVSSTNTDDTYTKKQQRYNQCVPQFVGVGVSYNRPRWMVTADYKYVDWSRMVSSVSYVKFQNQHQLYLGGKYTFGNLYRNPISVLLGMGINNSYIVVQKKKAEEYHVSAGLNWQLRGYSVLSFGLKYKGQINTPHSMQNEKSASLYLNITFSERVYRAKIQ